MRHHVRLLTTLSLLGTIALVTLSAAQSPAALIIVSPNAGRTIQPGQAVTISVHVPSGTYPYGVGIVGQDPLGFAGPSPVVGSTVAFTLTVPAYTPPGPYEITAAAADSIGALVSSNPITLDVERADIPTALLVDPPSVSKRLVGDTLLLTIFGVFAGGQEIDLTHSTKLKFNSENTTVAVVQDGILSAVGVGQTNLDVQYGSITAKISVTVPAGNPLNLRTGGRL
jgi:hypothetical protein